MKLSARNNVLAKELAGSVCDEHENKFQVSLPIQCETVELGASD